MDPSKIDSPSQVYHRGDPETSYTLNYCMGLLESHIFLIITSDCISLFISPCCSQNYWVSILNGKSLDHSFFPTVQVLYDVLVWSARPLALIFNWLLKRAGMDFRTVSLSMILKQLLTHLDNLNARKTCGPTHPVYRILEIMHRTDCVQAQQTCYWLSYIPSLHLST